MLRHTCQVAFSLLKWEFNANARQWNKVNISWWLYAMEAKRLTTVKYF